MSVSYALFTSRGQLM